MLLWDGSNLISLPESKYFGSFHFLVETSESHAGTQKIEAYDLMAIFYLLQ